MGRSAYDTTGVSNSTNTKPRRQASPDKTADSEMGNSDTNTKAADGQTKFAPPDPPRGSAAAACASSAGSPNQGGDASGNDPSPPNETTEREAKEKEKQQKQDEDEKIIQLILLNMY
jgi:hypothetical protein